MKIIKYSLISFAIITCLIFITLFFATKPPLLQNTAFSQAVYDDHHQLLRLTLANDEQYRVFTPLNKIPANVLNATLLQEDQYFYQHPGINPIAISRAIWQTYIKKQRKMGGSTITMQVARIQLNINSKSVMGKIEQIFRALQLETFYSKDKILEAYLNLASYGGNVQGVGAASLIYFGKPIDKLNLPETLTLVVIPQNPLKRSPSLMTNTQLKIARNKLFARWLTKYPNDADKTALMQLPLQLKTPRDLPFLASHFVDTVLQQDTKSLVLDTTLNLTLQRTLEYIGNEYIKKNRNQGITNYAAILVNTNTMEIKAMLGSADFFAGDIAGQVNGTQAKRSPGSTLKPFIYGLAMDQGLIHPLTVLKDAPVSFGKYNPENSDNDFVGPISAKQALITSRNIPAIDLANQLHNPSFYQFLQNANISLLRSESHYGLSTVLGGAEVSMEELISLYAMLANQGLLKPLRSLENQPLEHGKRLLTPEASFLVLDMLKDNPAPRSIFGATPTTAVAWKTGTSSGYRDAWSVGVFNNYALAVWVGDFKNRKYGRYIGTQSAAPLFFNMIDGITAKQKNPPSFVNNFDQLNLVQVDVCEASGLLPTPQCPRTTKTWFIPGTSPIKSDNVFRQILIDKTTGLRACQYNENTEFQTFEFWPTDLLKIFAQAGIARRTAPSYNPECSLETRDTKGTPPKIISPKEELIYNVRNNHTEDKIAFAAVADADVKQLFWFLNNNYIGSSSPAEMYYWSAKPGKYTIRVVDDRGRSDGRKLIVETPTMGAHN